MEYSLRWLHTTHESRPSVQLHLPRCSRHVVSYRLGQSTVVRVLFGGMAPAIPLGGHELVDRLNVNTKAVPSWALEEYALAKGGLLALTSPCGKGGILLRVVAIRLMG